jgi:hypothetical protein
MTRAMYRPGQCICVWRRTGKTWIRFLTQPDCPRHGNHDGRWKLAGP